MLCFADIIKEFMISGLNTYGKNATCITFKVYILSYMRIDSNQISNQDLLYFTNEIKNVILFKNI